MSFNHNHAILVLFRRQHSLSKLLLVKICKESTACRLWYDQSQKWSIFCMENIINSLLLSEHGGLLVFFLYITSVAVQWIWLPRWKEMDICALKNLYTNILTWKQRRKQACTKQRNNCSTCNHLTKDVLKDKSFSKFDAEFSTRGGPKISQKRRVSSSSWCYY